MINPFSVQPPEELPPDEIANNFVEMYTDFPMLQEAVNLFIHGPRGAGKSIMLRSLEHRVQQCLANEGRAAIPFFAVHVPIKREFFGNEEYRRLQGWKATTVGEHLLTIHTAQYLFQSLSENEVELSEATCSLLAELWEDCGGQSYDTGIPAFENFGDAEEFFEREARRVRQYFVRLPEDDDADIYVGALTALNDFLLPIVRRLKRDGATFEKPICFMIDDADNLPEAMQRVLNSWVSSRIGRLACFKVTTQLGYKTYKTVDSRIIESPHDFSEINIGSVYTSNKENFAKRIRAIVAKRLENAGIEVPPEEFFQNDYSQAERLDEIREALSKGKTEGLISLSGNGPSRDRDLASRYTIPAYMRELHATKSSHTYSYSGLTSLTDLSAGVVRWFLEPASRMYQAVLSNQPLTTVPQNIPVSTQDTLISDWSREFREKLNADPGSESGPREGASLHGLDHTGENYFKLGNLLDGIGNVCRALLLDDSASEQRFFSFVLADQPNEDTQRILDLGVRLGYLQKADLASKSSYGGRRPRYILSRRLGPHYRLDVSGYAAHLSVKSTDLALTLSNPQAFVRARVRTSGDDRQAVMNLDDEK